MVDFKEGGSARIAVHGPKNSSLIGEFAGGAYVNGRE